MIRVTNKGKGVHRVKQFMENLLENRSTNEAFDFYVTCESCGEEYGNTVVRFSKAGMFPVTQSEKILWNALYEQEMRMARQTAVRNAAEQMNYCPICKKVVCNQCFVICDELDMCKHCAASLQQDGMPVLSDVVGTTM